MDRAYKIIEIAGVSHLSFADAIQQAAQAAAAGGEKLSWFEVIEERGTLDGAKVAEYQVKLKIGIRL